VKKRKECELGRNSSMKKGTTPTITHATVTNTKRPQLPPLNPSIMNLSSEGSDDDNDEDEIMMIQLIKNLQHAKAVAMEENKVNQIYSNDPFRIQSSLETSQGESDPGMYRRLSNSNETVRI
jgi:hypothetical protein